MNLLLDTHIFLWFTLADPQLSQTTVNLIRDPANTVYLSVASVWECTVKYHSGKLPLPARPDIFLPARRVTYGFQSLGIDEGTIKFLPALPDLHRDPFDRILICQALQHNLTLVTVDRIVAQYPVQTMS
jgi:PIN domain nuclease of toxin-antitoxin system